MDGADDRNEFIVVNGEAAGDRLVIPHGTVTIGSDDGSTLRLPVSGVSRRHALLIPVHGRTILADQQSRNGSWVNGQRIDSPTVLNHGDLVQFGQVRLRFIDRAGDGGNGPPHSDSGKKGQQQQQQPPRERLGTALMYAGGINAVGLLGNSLASFLTELTPTWTWFITPLAGLLVALGVETLGYHRKGRGATQRPPADDVPSPGQKPALRRPLIATVLLTVLLLGAGGWLVTAGVSYAVGYFSGNEMGVQRLERQVAAEARGVRVAALGVQSTAHFTRVEILVSNGTSSSISLPLFQNAVLTGPDGTTYDADPFRSNWQPQIPAGGQRKGTLNFESQLPEGPTTVSLSFVTVFVQGFDGPRSITVPNIPLERWDGRASAAVVRPAAGGTPVSLPTLF